VKVHRVVLDEIVFKPYECLSLTGLGRDRSTGSACTWVACPALHRKATDG